MTEQSMIGASHGRRPSERPIEALGNPRVDALSGAVIAVVYFMLFIGWAATARLDAAAAASGVLEMSGHRQSIQHREGGIVDAIYVREGQRVIQGQSLIRLAAADVVAQERALSAQVVRLIALRSRLAAEQRGDVKLGPPAEFSSLKGEDREVAATALLVQQQELNARRATLAARREALERRVAQAVAQGHGFHGQASSAGEQLKLVEEQLKAMRPLAERGFVSRTRVRDLERARAELTGQRAQYLANVAQTQAAAREAKLNVIEADLNFSERVAGELREADMRLAEALPRWLASREQLARTDIKAPTTGEVVGLNIFTRGGVVAPGQRLMDIVPQRSGARIQLRLEPDDADNIRVGQNVYVRFSALHGRNMPNLTGILTRVSADVIVDERTGAKFYSGEVYLSDDQIAAIRLVKGREFDLRNGMMAQVMIPLRKRTALEYALEPMMGIFWRSFREN